MRQEDLGLEWTDMTLFRPEIERDPGFWLPVSLSGNMSKR